MFLSTVNMYSLAFGAINIMDDDNIPVALEDQIKISVALIEIVREPSVGLIVFAKQLGITQPKSQETIQVITQRGI